MKKLELTEIIENLANMEEKGIGLSKAQRTLVNEYFNTPSLYNVRIIAEYSEDFDVQIDSKINDTQDTVIEQSLEEFEEKMADKIDKDFSEYSDEIKDKICQWILDNFSIDVDFIDKMPVEPLDKPFFQQFLD